MARLPKLYQQSDKVIEILSRRAVNRFGKCYNTIRNGGFDELNVIKNVKTLYTQLAADNRELFEELFDDLYGYYFALYGGKKPDTVEARKSVTRILTEYGELSHYIYSNEISRKRDRTIEGVISAAGREREKVWNTSLRLWASMTRLYSDTVAYRAMVAAMRDVGIDEVQWITEADEKVCDDCKPLHGQIFPIDKIPPKPHIGCRCHLRPVTKGK